MKTNEEQTIRFSENHIRARWLTNVKNYHIEDRTIVVNLGNEQACISAPPEKYLLPRTSGIYQNVSVSNCDSLLLIEISEETNIGSIVLDPEWHLLGDISDFPRNTPLWKSAQYELGTVRFDPRYVTGLSSQPIDSPLRTYRVKVNLWFAPAKTNCAIHNHHMVPEFLEVHTQIYGAGRMQKFHAHDFSTLYQDVTMSPGNTHVPFASVDEEGAFIYPWHQYYADTDCIWMAIEFHPID
ncbi:hypothetical protein [Propionivibrio sp.]|uniref:hypothetical protein n=1 Tax=Propionivibrio sp. TaxID=2212460 RepID=UPI003BF49CFF